MTFKEFFLDKLLYIIGIIFVQITVEILLLVYDINIIIRLYIMIVPLLIFLVLSIYEYCKKNEYYKNIKDSMDELDERYIVSEVINNADFIEGKILKDIIKDAGKSMKENVNKYKFLQDEYREYIELWIHEIKLPISVIKLIIENNRNLVTENIDEEIDKVENFIEQVLFYSRSNNVEKDYIIKKSNLKEIVNSTIKKNKTILIQESISLNIHDIDSEVYTDNKWIIFILNQIIQNCVKYSKKKDKKIEIYSNVEKEKVTLNVIDNGIGIKKSDLSRVFEKGFTGNNGRILSKKSTGIGLYLCKKLCDKLGIGLEIDSTEGVSTSVKMIFPKGSYILSD